MLAVFQETPIRNEGFYGALAVTVVTEAQVDAHGRMGIVAVRGHGVAIGVRLDVDRCWGVHRGLGVDRGLGINQIGRAHV